MQAAEPHCLGAALPFSGQLPLGLTSGRMVFVLLHFMGAEFWNIPPFEQLL